MKTQKRKLKKGTVIKFFNGELWSQTKPIKKEIEVEGAFSKYGIFKFQLYINGSKRLCSVDYSKLIST